MRSKGFTIVELLIVLCIIGILSMLTISSYQGIQKKAKETEIARQSQSFNNSFCGSR